MSSAKRNVRNLAINYSSFIASGLVMLLLSPFVVRSLGPVEYGIWSLLNVLTGYMGLLDLGVRGSTGRHINLYLGREDHAAVDQTVRTSLAFYSILAFFILAAAGLLGWVFPHAFSSVPVEYRPVLMWLVPLMAVNVLTSAASAVFASVLTAHERFDLACGIDLFTLGARTIGAVWVLLAGNGLVGLAFVVVGSNLLPLIGNAWLGKRIYSPLRFWPLHVNRERLRELGTYGVGIFIATVAWKVIGQTDLMIVGIAIDVASVTVYSVGAMLVYYSTNLTTLICKTFQPSLQKAVARNEMGSARWIFFREVRLASLVGIPAYVGFILYAQPFIRLWMLGPSFGESSVRSAATVMGILAGAKLLSLFEISSGPLLWSMGRVRFIAGMSILQALVNLGLSLVFVLAFGWGLWGVALGTFASRFLVATFPVPWYACRTANIDFRDYVAQIGGRGLIAIGLFGCWCYAAKLVVPCTTWPMFALSVMLALAGFVPIALLILIPESDRTRVRNKLRELTAYG